MKKISDYLEKFQKLLDLDKENQNIIVEAVKRFTGEEIKGKDIKIVNRDIYIRQNPYAKREILLKKRQIIDFLQKTLINLKIEDIK